MAKASKSTVARDARPAIGRSSAAIALVALAPDRAAKPAEPVAAPVAAPVSEVAATPAADQTASTSDASVLMSIVMTTGLRRGSPSRVARGSRRIDWERPARIAPLLPVLFTSRCGASWSITGIYPPRRNRLVSDRTSAERWSHLFGRRFRH
jgi:hypothetical protein